MLLRCSGHVQGRLLPVFMGCTCSPFFTLSKAKAGRLEAVNPTLSTGSRPDAVNSMSLIFSLCPVLSNSIATSTSTSVAALQQGLNCFQARTRLQRRPHTGLHHGLPLV